MTEFFVPFQNVSYTAGSDRESRDMLALKGITVEAATEEEAVAIVSRVLDRWRVYFNRVAAAQTA